MAIATRKSENSWVIMHIQKEKSIIAKENSITTRRKVNTMETCPIYITY